VICWGDGHVGGSSLMTARKNKVTTLNVYGQIPAGQDAAVGTYTDSIVATVTF
jgi:spore coat protein U-like protein